MQAGWAPQSAEAQERTATVIASGVGGFHAIAEAVRTTDGKGPRRLSPFTIRPFSATWRPPMCRSAMASRDRWAPR